MKALKYVSAMILCAGILVPANAQNVNTSITPGSTTATLNSDTPPTDVYKRENIIATKKPVPYTYIREADVMWAKDIWRTIDLRERMNIPLRYPLEGRMADGKRYSLYGLLMEGIRSEEITPYEYTDWKNPFDKRTTLKQIYELVEADTIPDDNGNILRIDDQANNVTQFVIQEKWFFDKQHSVMKVRIVALSPILFKQRYDASGNMLPDVQRIPLFIVYFPQCRNLFATHAVYNPGNDAQEISFDDLFFQRRFASTIAAESNVYGNRFIVDYLRGQDALMEADKIKKDLFTMEHDLWEY